MAAGVFQEHVNCGGDGGRSVCKRHEVGGGGGGGGGGDDDGGFNGNGDGLVRW